MTEKKSEILQQIETDRLDQLYQRSIATSLALFLACSVYILFLSQHFPIVSLLVWYGLLLAVLAGRMVLNSYYSRAAQYSLSQGFWLKAFRVSILLVGLIIGSVNIFFFPREPLSYLLLAIFLPCGIVAGAVTILVDFASFILYALTLILPVIYQTIIAGDRTFTGTGVLVIVLTFIFLKASREINKNFSLTMRLRYENKALVEELQKERNKLKSRLNRILNDSFSEIFVVDADSFNCLMVNKGAVKNLGYSEEEFRDINLLDIFVQLDKDSLLKLLKPLFTGRRDVVIHNGYNCRRDGSKYPVEARLQLSTSDEPPIIVISAQDISERRNWEKKLIYQANFDQLTGLFNRHYMQSYMNSVFARAKRQNSKVALLFMDIDNFKNINDSLGHNSGDEVLKHTANRIRSLLRETDTPARTGGDEFTILIEGLSENSHAELVAQKLVEIFKEPFLINDQEIYTSASVGISIYPDDSKSLDQLMQYADIAMYQAKEDGRNSHRFFSNEMRRYTEEQMIITNHLRYALVKNEYSLLYQPKIDIVKGRIIGAEALLRWNNHKLGSISPGVFIPLAENMGLMNDIGKWVLEEACKEAAGWQQYGENLHVSVNVSPQQFRTSSLVEDIQSALEKSGLASHFLEIEITESLLLHDSEQHLMILNSLNSQGVRLALDDFGTGYSSLSYLRKFPLQVLKIDRSFIHDLLDDRNNSKTLVEAIVVMARSLKLEVVAEGVEDEQQLAFLRQHDVATAQGYFFSPPVPAVKFQELLKGN